MGDDYIQRLTVHEQLDRFATHVSIELIIMEYIFLQYGTSYVAHVAFYACAIVDYASIALLR
jgi:hypothetical protein